MLFHFNFWRHRQHFNALPQLPFTYVWFTGCDRRAHCLNYARRAQGPSVCTSYSSICMTSRARAELWFSEEQVRQRTATTTTRPWNVFRSSGSFDVATRPGAYQGGTAYDKLHVRSACSTCDKHMSKYGGVWQEVKLKRERGRREGRSGRRWRGAHAQNKKKKRSLKIFIILSLFL